MADLVKSTLGPKGMDKILKSQGNPGRNEEVVVTNDGATILKSIFVDNAAAKVLIEISKVQDSVVGDGTTSVCVFAGELMREAERLINQRIHPQTIVAGYIEAERIAQGALLASSVDHGNDAERFREDLLNIARTTISSKILNQDKELFARLAVDAVLRLRGSTDLDLIQIIKKRGGSLSDSFLDDGFILEKRVGVRQPKRVENATVLVANTPMDADRVKIFGAKVKVDSTAKVAEIEKAERERMLAKCAKIAAHNCNVFINRQLIYNLPEEYFADRGIMAIEHADFEGVERLAKALDADIVSTFDTPELVRLGRCDLIEEVLLGEERVIRFSGLAGGAACTIVLRGATQYLLDEADRSLHDALAVLSQTVKETRTVLGAGCSESLMAAAVDHHAQLTSGKRAMAIEAYARALRMLPTIIADNAGLDSADLVARLRAAHAVGDSTYGIDVVKGEVSCVRTLGITESYKVKRHVVSSATEAAEMLLRVDEIFKAAPRRREADPRLRG